MVNRCGFDMKKETNTNFFNDFGEVKNFNKTNRRFRPNPENNNNDKKNDDDNMFSKVLNDTKGFYNFLNQLKKEQNEDNKNYEKNKHKNNSNFLEDTFYKKNSNDNNENSNYKKDINEEKENENDSDSEDNNKKKKNKNDNYDKYDDFNFDFNDNKNSDEKDFSNIDSRINKILGKDHDLNFNKRDFHDEDNTIIEINKELNNLIEFNNVILRNEEYFINSIKNIGKSLEEGNKRDSKDIKFLFSGFSKDIENSNKAIDALKYHKEILLDRDLKYINLNSRNLDNQDFKYISQIRFNQLREIDLSENKIINIKPFNKMSLPFLEFLNLSYNEIQIIEPVAKLKSKNLEYIFLQRNKIKDLETFLVSDFPALKILRVEDNNIFEKNEWENEKEKEILDIINKKYREKFIYKSMKEQIREFKYKYFKFLAFIFFKNFKSPKLFIDKSSICK